MEDWIAEEPAFLVEDQNWAEPMAQGTAGMLRLSEGELRFTDFNDRIVVQMAPSRIAELAAHWLRSTFMEVVLSRPLRGFSRTLRFRMSNRALDFPRILAETMPEESPYLESREAPETLIFLKWYRVLFGRREMNVTEVFREEKLWGTWWATLGVPIAVLILLGLSAHLFVANVNAPADPTVRLLVQRRILLYVVPLFGMVLLIGAATIDFLMALALGGRGDFLTHLYTRTLFQIPLWAVTISALLATSTTYLACTGPVLGLVLQLYAFYLVWVSNRAVHLFGLAKSFLTALTFLAVEMVLLAMLLNDWDLLLQ